MSLKKYFDTSRNKSFLEAEALGLPTPRLQFRFIECDPRTHDGYNWLIHYELVIRLQKFDVRNPREYKQDSEYAMRLGGQMRGQSKTRSPVNPDGSIDLPWRDSTHAMWDGMQLGITEVWAVANGVAHDLSEKYAGWIAQIEAEEIAKGGTNNIGHNVIPARDMKGPQ